MCEWRINQENNRSVSEQLGEISLVFFLQNTADILIVWHVTEAQALFNGDADYFDPLWCNLASSASSSII